MILPLLNVDARISSALSPEASRTIRIRTANYNRMAKVQNRVKHRRDSDGRLANKVNKLAVQAELLAPFTNRRC